MAASDNTIEFGVFRDRALAKQAIDELQHAGFRDDEIRILGKEAGSGGVLDHLVESFTGHETHDEQFSEDLASKGIPADEVNYYQHEVEAGRTVVMVESYGHQQQAREILYHYGAYDASNFASQGHDERIIPVREEKLNVHKQTVETGAVIVRKEVINEERTITVPVRREELVIERLPDPAQSSAYSSDEDEEMSEALIDGGTLRIVLREERVLVEKQTVIKEEIFISKRQIQETQHIEDTLRKEEAHIERVGDVNIHGAQVEEVSREV